MRCNDACSHCAAQGQQGANSKQKRWKRATQVWRGGGGEWSKTRRVTSSAVTKESVCFWHWPKPQQNQNKTTTKTKNQNKHNGGCSQLTRIAGAAFRCKKSRCAKAERLNFPAVVVSTQNMHGAREHHHHHHLHHQHQSLVLSVFHSILSCFLAFLPLQQLSQIC